ncbi:efflux pump, RND family, outer membrane protein [Syntrophotalea carbinolica DSM 2380]|uniref:Efflux pump, RND family, outer membrane protein n=1 Tax=Syntrophotalea carbinolica (strain DSM 2380 / NBRC 103641 / GraBd1) TaxID=338963 RepID=Q3A7M0_SYNC1|nr:TolC family protein [Syntrophotalea carbinolica]ABA87624.2 efflux pump, RND family, outer membrane protein [Syntrophotalea carbinolica DSM 2380]
MDMHKMETGGLTVLGLVFALLVILSLPCVAAEQSTTLTLKQALGVALKHNQALRLSADEVRSARVALRQQKDDFLPEASLEATAGGGHEQGAVGSDRNYHALSAEVAVKVNLFNGFADQAALDQADKNLSARQQDLNRQQQTLVFDTVSAYLDAVKSLEQIQVAQQTLEDNRRQLADIEAYHRVGRRPITDVYKQRAETAQARSDLLTAQRDYAVSKLALKQVLGVEATTDYEVVLPEDVALRLAPSTDLESLLGLARKQRPDLLAREKERLAAEAQVKVAKAGAWPTVDLSAGVGTGYDSRSDSAFGSQMDEDNLYGKASVDLNIPLFDRHLTRNEVAQARINRHSIDVEWEQLQCQVEVEIGQALQEYLTALDQLEVARAQLTYAQDALDSTRQRYRVGAATLTELTDARSTFVESRYALLEAQIDRMMRTVAMAYYRGDLSERSFVGEGDV